jgi:hypothetical protein
MSTKQSTLALAAAALASALALSCNVTAGAGTTTTEEGTAPAAAPHVVAPPAKLDLRAGDIESSGAPPSSEMVAKTNALATRLGSAIGQDQGVRIAFVSCEQAPCSARLSGSSMESLQQAIGDVQRDQQGQITATTRERLDPFMGQSFEADITLAPDAAP